MSITLAMHLQAIKYLLMFLTASLEITTWNEFCSTPAPVFVPIPKHALDYLACKYWAESICDSTLAIRSEKLPDALRHLSVNAYLSPYVTGPLARKRLMDLEKLRILKRLGYEIEHPIAPSCTCGHEAGL